MNEPGYFAIIPAPVRYHADITPNAKLLYGELTALCDKMGFCWASNTYFASLYKVSASAVSEWVASLKKAGFIRVEIDQRRGNERKIFMLDALRHMAETYPPKGDDPSPPKGDSHKESSTKKNSTMKEGDRGSLPISIEKGRKKFIPPSPPEIEAYIVSIGMNGDAKREAAKFFDYHEQGGWMMKGGKKMACWKAACRIWKGNVEERNPKSTPSPDKLAATQVEYHKFITGHPNPQMRDKFPKWSDSEPAHNSFVRSEFREWARTGKYRQ